MANFLVMALVPFTLLVGLNFKLYRTVQVWIEKRQKPKITKEVWRPIEKWFSLSGVRSTLCKKEASERKARTKDCFSPDPPGHSLRMLQRGSSIVLHLIHLNIPLLLLLLLLLQLLPHLINIHIPFCLDFSMIYPLKKNAISILFFLGSSLIGKR